MISLNCSIKRPWNAFSSSELLCSSVLSSQKEWEIEACLPYEASQSLYSPSQLPHGHPQNGGSLHQAGRLVDVFRSDTCFQNLGCTVHHEKSDLAPSKTFIYLGLKWNPLIIQGLSRMSRVSNYIRPLNPCCPPETPPVGMLRVSSAEPTLHPLQCLELG